MSHDITSPRSASVQNNHTVIKNLKTESLQPTGDPEPVVYGTDRFDAFELSSPEGVECLGELTADELVAMVALMQHVQSPRPHSVGPSWAMTTILNSLHLANLTNAPVHEDLVARNTQGEIVAKFPYFDQSDAGDWLMQAGAKRSVSLSEISTALEAQGINTKVSHVQPETLEVDEAKFRDEVKASLADSRSNLLVNFRAEDGRGRYGVVCAYNAEQDRCLILRIKPALADEPALPCYEWIALNDLTEAMASVTEKQHLARGYLRLEVSEAGQAPTTSKNGCVPLNSQEGRERLARCDPSSLLELAQLMPFFEPQPNVSFCNIRTVAMFANALKLPLAVAIQEEKAKRGERSAVINEKDILEQVSTQKLKVNGRLIDADRIHYPRGAFMDEVVAIGEMLGAKVQVRHLDGTDAEYETFLKEVAAALASPEHHVMVQYNRPDAGQQGGGHYSAVVARDPVTKSLLVFDTASFKVEFHWIPEESFFKAMATVDQDAANEGFDGRRGYAVFGSGRPQE